MQSFCLATHDKGLGTCIMAIAVGYPDVIPEAVGKRFVVGVAIGYPDWDALLNCFSHERAELDEQVLSWAQ